MTCESVEKGVSVLWKAGGGASVTGGEVENVVGRREAGAWPAYGRAGGRSNSNWVECA